MPIYGQWAVAILLLCPPCELYANMHRRTRRALTERFPFGVYYRIESDCVVVVAVA